MRRTVILIIAFVLALGFAAWWNSSVQVVKRRTKSLMTVLTIPASEQEATRKIRSMELDRFLDDSVQLSAKDIPGFEDTLNRDEINDGFIYFCQRATSCDFSVKKFQSVETTGKEARLKALVSVRLNIPGGDCGVSGTHEDTLVWRHKNDAWKLKFAELHKIGP